MLVGLLALLLLGLLLAVILLWRARTLRLRTGLPQGRVVYADTGAWARCERPLFSRRYLLTGKPDYLVEERGEIIPVEVKPRRVASRLYRSDILQLAAYCLLIEDLYRQAPSHGIVKYHHAAFAVDYTPQLRSLLLDTLAQMRRHLTADDVAPDHDNPNRCRGCGYRADCEKSLV